MDDRTAPERELDGIDAVVWLGLGLPARWPEQPPARPASVPPAAVLEAQEPCDDA